MDFPRSESKETSRQAVSSYASLSDGDGYSTEIHCPSFSQSISCLRLHYFWKIVTIHFESSTSVTFQGGKGLEFSYHHWKISYSPHQKPDNFLSASGFAMASSLGLIVEIQSLTITTGYLLLPSPSLMRESNQQLFVKNTINNWWQGSQSSFCLVLSQKYWAMQVKQQNEFSVENSHISAWSCD